MGVYVIVILPQFQLSVNMQNQTMFISSKHDDNMILALCTFPKFNHMVSIIPLVLNDDFGIPEWTVWTPK